MASSSKEWFVLNASRVNLLSWILVRSTGHTIYNNQYGSATLGTADRSYANSLSTISAGYRPSTPGGNGGRHSLGSLLERLLILTYKFNQRLTAVARCYH